LQEHGFDVTDANVGPECFGREAPFAEARFAGGFLGFELGFRAMEASVAERRRIKAFVVG
jgi:hypothetical protein